MSKVPSPCIDVCKFKRDGHCIGCSMTKAQKSAFKALQTDRHREAFVELVVAQQAAMGRYSSLGEGIREEVPQEKGISDSPRRGQGRMTTRSQRARRARSRPAKNTSQFARHSVQSARQRDLRG